jgi:hypothetical protein
MPARGRDLVALAQNRRAQLVDLFSEAERRETRRGGLRAAPFDRAGLREVHDDRLPSCAVYRRIPADFGWLRKSGRGFKYGAVAENPGLRSILLCPIESPLLQRRA